MKQFSRVERSRGGSERNVRFEYFANENPGSDFICLRDKYKVQISCTMGWGRGGSADAATRWAFVGWVYGPSEAELKRAQRFLFSQLGWNPVP